MYDAAVLADCQWFSVSSASGNAPVEPNITYPALILRWSGSAKPPQKIKHNTNQNGSDTFSLGNKHAINTTTVGPWQ